MQIFFVNVALLVTFEFFVQLSCAVRELPGSVMTDDNDGGSDILGILESDAATAARSGAETSPHAPSSLECV